MSCYLLLLNVGLILAGLQAFQQNETDQWSLTRSAVLLVSALGFGLWPTFGHYSLTSATFWCFLIGWHPRFTGYVHDSLGIFDIDCRLSFLSSVSSCILWRLQCLWYHLALRSWRAGLAGLSGVEAPSVLRSCYAVSWGKNMETVCIGVSKKWRAGCHVSPTCCYMLPPLEREENKKHTRVLHKHSCHVTQPFYTRLHTIFTIWLYVYKIHVMCMYHDALYIHN